MEKNLQSSYGKTSQVSSIPKITHLDAFLVRYAVKKPNLTHHGIVKDGQKKWPNSGCVFGPQRVIAWRVLDAQYFGLAQRRKRVFVVASAREGFHPPQVLLEFDGLRRDIAPSRSKGSEVASTLSACSFTGGPSGKPEGAAGGHFQVVAKPFTPSSFANYSEGVGTLKANGGDLGGGSETILVMAHGQAGAEHFAYGIQSTVIGRKPENGPQGSGISDEISFTLTQTDEHAVAYGIQYCDKNGTRKDRENGGMYVTEPEIAQALTLADSPIKVVQNMRVRRLMPVECERLQGFPDGYTDIGTLDKPSADTHRYKALGNSMAVSVMNWIGRRIEFAIRKPWR